MKTTLIAVGVGVAMLFGWFGISFFSGGVPVEVAEVTEGPISAYVDERGKTHLPRTHLITMPYNGRIAEITVEEGQRVEKGETVLARFVQEDLELERQLAQAAVDRLDAAIKENKHLAIEMTALKQARSYVKSMDLTVKAADKRRDSGQERFDFASKMFDRLSELRSGTNVGVITQEQLDQARLRKIESQNDYQQDDLIYRSLQAIQAATNLMPEMVLQYIERKALQTDKLSRERAEAKAQLQQVELKLRRGVMKSPVTGIVLERPLQNEQFLSAGTTLLEIAALDDLNTDLEVEADVLSQDVVKVKPGNRVEIRGPAIGPEPVRGTVKRKYPGGFTKVSSLGVEQQSVKVIVGFNAQDLAKLRDKDRNDLGIGYRVHVRIFTEEKSGVRRIPRSALFRGPKGGWQVFAVTSGRVRLRDVEVGVINDEQVEIVKGLNPGEQVVLAPETSLSDGDRVSASN